ncbi:hydrogenase maturation protease [Candidatus Fermentibacteria bacterium]|nr:hydrogenase maturation protease [Candidatus Fermentibacteria bacterium]
MIASAGNRLLGDDGVGHVVLESLRAHSPWDGRVGFLPLEGDLFELADWVEKADHLIILDAIAGEPVGQIDRTARQLRPQAPSFHQTDVATVLWHLEAVLGIEKVALWEIWGIRIAMPTRFSEHLSPFVAQAAVHLEHIVTARVHQILDAHTATSD